MKDQNLIPDYYEFRFEIPSDEHPLYGFDAKDIIIAELSELGFESFTESGEELLAYININQFKPEFLNDLEDLPIQPKEHRIIKGENWNAIWESNFEPVVISDKLYIRANFHPIHDSIKNEVIITPKMSFGTGHHATTKLMLEELLSLEITGKKVMDMGTGSGVLAIVAKKMGANEVFAVDNDPQCILNTKENYLENNLKIENIYLITQMPELDKFDIILANIQRNVLIEQLPFYANHLAKGGILLISGIEISDKELLIKKGKENGLNFDYFKALNNWIMIRFQA